VIDVIFESIGGDLARALLDALVPGAGRLLFYGLLSGEPPAILPYDLLLRGVGLLVAAGAQPTTPPAGPRMSRRPDPRFSRGRRWPQPAPLSAA
jgi:NADPH:quinone reductase-like Zn-dependent oxidoreductase